MAGRGFGVGDQGGGDPMRRIAGPAAAAGAATSSMSGSASRRASARSQASTDVSPASMRATCSRPPPLSKNARAAWAR